MFRVRFAPSPTGYLHIGGARTALFNYMLAKKMGGTFVLRIDDTDIQRSRPEYEKEICESLLWMGLEWNEGPDKPDSGYGPYRQSERKSRYYEYGERLLKAGRAIRDRDGALYLRYPDHEIIVRDMICGDCHFQPSALGPAPVLIRTDGEPTYHLASVADDIEMAITHVVRGQDHLTNSAKHQSMFEALGAKVPEFAHLPLLLGSDGTKLSKRSSEGLTAVKDFREAGYLPQAVVNYLVLLGWSHPDGKEHLTLEDAAEAFTLERVSRTGSKFEVSRLLSLNGYWLRKLPIAELVVQVQPFISDYQPLLAQRSDDFWPFALEELRSDISLLSETKGLASLIFALEIELTKEASEYLQNESNYNSFVIVLQKFLQFTSALILDDNRDSLSEEQFRKLINLIKKESGLEKREIFHALRIAITGTLSGPELKVLVPLINRQTLQERVSGVLSRYT